MALITVHLRMVSPKGVNDVPDPAPGKVTFTPATHGIFRGSMRTVETVISPIVDGVMEPVELTPAVWKVRIQPAAGNPWPEMQFTLTDGMPEPVNLADLLPEVVVNGKALAKGDPGPGISNMRWEYSDDGVLSLVTILSDGREFFVPLPAEVIPPPPPTPDIPQVEYISDGVYTVTGARHVGDGVYEVDRVEHVGDGVYRIV